jgi:hypothetical protein
MKSIFWSHQNLQKSDFFMLANKRLESIEHNLKNLSPKREINRLKKFITESRWVNSFKTSIQKTSVRKLKRNRKKSETKRYKTKKISRAKKRYETKRKNLKNKTKKFEKN